MDSFNDSQWSKRLWCVFEAFTATQKGIDFTILLSRDANEAFVELMKSAGLQEVRDDMQRIDVRKAKATEPADERAIHRYIEKTTGYDAVNAAVKDKLKDCLTKEVEKFLRHAPTEKARSTSTKSLRLW